MARAPEAAGTSSHVKNGSTSARPGRLHQQQSELQAPNILPANTIPILGKESGRGDAAQPDVHFMYALPLHVKCKACGRKQQKGTSVHCVRHWDEGKTFQGRILVKLSFVCAGCGRNLELLTNSKERDIQCGESVAISTSSKSRPQENEGSAPATLHANGAGSSHRARHHRVPGQADHVPMRNVHPSVFRSALLARGMRPTIVDGVRAQPAGSLFASSSAMNGNRTAAPRMVRGSGAPVPGAPAQVVHTAATSGSQAAPSKPTGVEVHTVAGHNSGHAQRPETHVPRNSRMVSGGQETGARHASDFITHEFVRAQMRALKGKSDHRGHRQAGGSIHVAHNSPKASPTRHRHAADASGAATTTASSSAAAPAGAGSSRAAPAGPSGAARAGPSAAVSGGPSGAARAGPSGAAQAGLSRAVSQVLSSV